MEKKISDPIQVWGGIECTINRIGNGFLDQLDYVDYYKNSYIDQFVDLQITKLRFPILWEKHQPSLNEEINWDWTAQQLDQLKTNNIDVIAGLVHHGSGPAFTNLLDPQFPHLLAQYAREVAVKFPWINYYTPVNEPLTTARFSGLYGLWFPHLKNDRAFLLMLLNQLKGVVLSMREIRKINPTAQLVQTEDLGKTYSTDLLRYQARFENQRRWLTYDLLCGRVNEKHKLWKYLKRFNIPPEDLNFFIENPCTPDIFGFNYYVTSERYLDENVRHYPAGLKGGNKKHSYADVEVARVQIDEETGVKVLLKEAWNRYQQPIALTEVHLHCHREEQLRWFKYIYESCSELSAEGVTIRAITSWAILGSFGWNKLLTVPRGEYEPGAYDMRSGVPRATALVAYIKNIASHTGVNQHLISDKGWWQRDTRLIYRPAAVELNAVKFNYDVRPVAIIGRTGTLGKAFAKVCSDRAINNVLLGREDCDISEPYTIERIIQRYKPWAIINAAGYVKVDEAEADAETCFRNNFVGAYNLAAACHRHDIQLATFSSDLVFDGTKRQPYIESDVPNALNVYGKSKQLGEEHVLLANPSALVIRTSAFFGPYDEYNFLHWVETNLVNQIEVPAANDIYISPTYVPDLVHTTLDLLIDGEKGIWHLANEGAITWADLAYLTAKQLKFNGNLIKAVPSSHLNLAAQRPEYTVLGTEKGQMLPSLKNALERYFAEKKRFAMLAG